MSIDCFNIGLVVAFHGSRNKEAILESHAQVSLLVKFQKGIIEQGYLEFEIPGIGEAIDHAIDRGAKTVVVLPAMLTAAHHVKTDIPNIIQHAQKKHPHISILYGRHIELHPKIVELCKKQIQEIGSGLDMRETLLIVVGRGAKDSDGNQDVITLTGLLKEAFHFGEAKYCYTSVAIPLFQDVMEQVRDQSILILPYLLFSGVLSNKIRELMQLFQEKHPNISVKLVRTLGPDILVRDALMDRYGEAILLAEKENADDEKKDCKDTT